VESAPAPRASRADLDALVAHHRLGGPAVEALLVLADARPSRDEDLRFARRLLGLAGVLSLLAAVVFFLAANWEALGRFARFGLVGLPLLASGALALWRPPPSRVGRLGLLAAFVLTGGLLALFGQTYQTGADVHELFFGWALLGLPLVVGGRWAVTWGAWLLVLDLALALLCGFIPPNHALWEVLSGAGFTVPVLFVLPLALNVALWAIVEAASRTRWAEVAAPWLGRLALAVGFAIATWGAVVVIVASGAWHERSGRGGLLLLAGALAAAGVTVRTLKAQRDVFPVAVVAASVLALGTAVILRGVEHRSGDPIGTFFLVTGWIVSGSAAASWVLMGLQRQWKREGTIA
jgi:uncharacterized membrane protein